MCVVLIKARGNRKLSGWGFWWLYSDKGEYVNSEAEVYIQFSDTFNTWDETE